MNQNTASVDGSPAVPADFAQRLLETLLNPPDIPPPFVCPIVLATDEDRRFAVDRAYDLVVKFYRIDTTSADGTAQRAV